MQDAIQSLRHHRGVLSSEELRKIGPAHIIPCHCTGRKATHRIEQAMPGQFILNMSGTTLTFQA